MARRTGVSMDANTLRVAPWLVIAADGATRLSKATPALAPNEIAMRLNLTVPRAVFRKPSLEATINLPASIGAPDKIDAAVVGNIKAAVQQATGLELSIGVKP